MTPAITLVELLAWNRESSDFWKAHLDANPALLELPCDIGGTANVQEFVRHIWAVEMIWAQRIAGLPVTDRKEIPAGPHDALFGLHEKAVEIFCEMLDDPARNWDETITLKFPWLPPDGLTASRRKLAGHALFHSQRHWAQLATLVRAAGFPSGFKGDILFSAGIR
ncbi:MAG: DinB family protein [Terracidiphilus sp.]|nr:DinB family protein [Terracidiphilus sp.]